MENPKESAKPGDILFSKKNKNLVPWIKAHSMVYLGAGDRADMFHGAMLTHSDKKKFNNIPLSNEHFVEYGDDGKKYEFQYDNTFFSPKRYYKLMDWQPFEKKGALTAEGLKFILEHISEKAEVFRLNKPLTQ